MSDRFVLCINSCVTQETSAESGNFRVFTDLIVAKDGILSLLILGGEDIQHEFEGANPAVTPSEFTLKVSFVQTCEPGASVGSGATATSSQFCV